MMMMTSSQQETEEARRVKMQSAIISGFYNLALDFKHRRRRRRRIRSRIESSRRLGEIMLQVLLIIATTQMVATVVAGSEILEKPQPLIYLHDSGSGDGYPRPVQFRDNTFSSSSSSSPMSPSLIAAKCWNNYENDNDCKQLNVITGPGEQQQQQQQQQHQTDDDSLITPVVIFESSSSYEPAAAPIPTTNDQTNDLSANTVQPTLDHSSNQRNENSAVLARHRTPPASREDIYVTTSSPNSIYHQSTDQRQQYRPTPPTTSVYVATPQPNKGKHKTTTEGRKCRDENDDDCDEPENNNNNNNNSKSDAANEEDKDGDDKDEDDNSGDNGAEDDSATVKPLRSGQDETTLESGSGEAPGDDDNEDTDDDDSSNEGEDLESSGNFDNTDQQAASTPRFIEVSSTQTNLIDNDESPGSSTTTTTTTPTTTTTTQQGAQIEVVVHPTLPPSFPTTTTTTTTTQASTQSGDLDNSLYMGASTPSTIMPDDTYKSKPVFPSTSEPSNEIDSGQSNRSQNKYGGGGDGGDISNNIGESSNNEATTTSEPIDLATFKPIPMMPQVEQPTRSSSADSFRNMTGGPQDGQGSSSASLADKYKFEPGATTSMPAFKFDNAWRAQPARPPAFQSANTDTSSWQQRDREQLRQRAKFGDTSNVPQTAQQFGGSSSASSQVGKSRPEPGEMLPTLLLYASICILVVLAVIFVIMAAAIWRQKNARQRALLLKSQLAGQMVPSMSHASQLMVNGNNMMPPGHQQQPGLLTTYGPGRGLQLQNKITTSLVRGSPDNSGDNLQGDDMGSVISKQPLEQTANGSGDSNQNVAMQDRAGYQPTAATSWSTEDQTTSASSAGSQDRPESQQTVQQRKYQSSAATRQQFNNSLSDGRQNSSSMSDSQESPDGAAGQPGALQGGDQSYSRDNQMYPTQPTHVDQVQGHPPPAQQMLYNQPAMHGNGQIYTGSPMKRPPLIQDQMMGPSQSEDSFVQQQQQQPPQPPPPPNNNQMQHDYPGSNGFAQPPPIRGAYPMNQPEIRQNNGYPVGGAGQLRQPPRFSNGTPPAFHHPTPSGGPVPPNGHVSALDYAPFDGPPINQARIAMNPLATMSRRPAGYPALNRNIYSEDSSSLMTASPSLARTSSSSSFAFNNHQLSLDRAIEAKSMIDPTTGRLFNDYSQINLNKNGSAGPPPPPIVGRKNPGEAWYV